MNYYETLYIVHPALESGRLKDIILEVEENLKKTGGTPLATEFWGKRKLAYFIDKQKYGTYVLVQFNGEGKCTSDFAVELEHNPNILAYLTTVIEKDAVKEIEEDLETQIAGKTREIERAESSSEAGKKEESDMEAVAEAVVSELKTELEGTAPVVSEDGESAENAEAANVEETVSEESPADENTETQEKAEEETAVSEEE